MIHQFLQGNLIPILIFTITFGLFGLFLYKNNFKKICCLASSYIGIILLLVLFAKNSTIEKELLTITLAIFIIFIGNIIVAIHLIRNFDKNN